MEITKRGHLVIDMTIVCGVFEVVAVALRMLSRRKTALVLAADDWLILITLVPSFGMLAAGPSMVLVGGLGHHIETLSDSTVRKLLISYNATIMTYALTQAITKISILLLYRRIFSTATFRRTAEILCFIIGCWCFSALTVAIFQCRPIRGMWTMSMQYTSKCIDISAYYKAYAATNIVLDITVLCMPIYMVWNLRLPTRQKIMLSGIFLLGALSCLASIMRLVTIELVKGGDLPYTLPVPYMWSQVEAATAIICACLPTYRPLFAGLNLRSLSNLSWSRSKSKLRASESNNTDSEKGRMSYHNKAVDSDGSTLGEELKSHSYVVECEATSQKSSINDV